MKIIFNESVLNRLKRKEIRKLNYQLKELKKNLGIRK